MSKVFRPSTTVGNAKSIGIRNIFLPTSEDGSTELTLDQILAERDRLLNNARNEIALMRESIRTERTQLKEEIESARNEWNEEKAVLQQQAYEEGFQMGYEEGRQKALAEMSESISQANEIVAQSQVQARDYLESQERLILELAIQAAGRILGEVLDEDEERFLSIVRRGLKEVREMKEVKLYVSSRYHRLVSEQMDELSAIFPPDVPLLLFVNEDLDDIESYIETNHGRVVVSIDEQLAELRNRLAEILESVE